jgi:hypothetical protein
MKTFNELRKINVNEHTEKKGRFTYLSWTWAVDQLLQNDPTATWTFGDPIYFSESVMVFCTVNAFGKSMTCQMPVINNQNKAIPNPNAMDVNTAMQRCLVKTISLFGIGLYIYAGEDLPQEDEKEPIDTAPYISTIMKTLTMDELKNSYIAAVKACGTLKELEQAKDIRKNELMAVQS